MIEEEPINFSLLATQSIASVKMKMTIIIIGGFLGSGKTSTIISLSQKMSTKFNKKVAVVVNEIGEVAVDAKIIQEYGLKVKEIGGGCICCQLLVDLETTISALYSLFKPDIIFIEPTGIATVKSIKDNVVSLRSKEFDMTVGPSVVLFDALRARELLDDELLEDPDYIVVKQLREADVVAINKIDVADEETLKWCEEMIRKINANATLIRISALKGYGLSELLGFLLKSSS
jgi:G3E family GTPase